MKICFKSRNTLRELLMKVKAPLSMEKRTGVIYEIPCQDYEKVYYIGETGRSLQKRMMEHKAAVRRGDWNNGIAVHAWDEDHRIDWEGANIKEVEQQLWKRKALEAVHIHMQPNTNNLDRGLILSDVWLPFMKKQQ